MHRISKFLERDVRAKSKNLMVENNDQHDTVDFLRLKNAGFQVAKAKQDDDTYCDSETSAFEVSKFNLSLVKGEVLAVCGPVASGKVSFFK